MVASSLISIIVASLIALLSVVALVIAIVHVWLRTTVGKFESNVNFEVINE